MKKKIVDFLKAVWVFNLVNGIKKIHITNAVKTMQIQLKHGKMNGCLLFTPTPTTTATLTTEATPSNPSFVVIVIYLYILADNEGGYG